MISQATPYTSFPTSGRYMFKEQPEPVSKIAHLLSDDMELYTGNNHQLRSIQRNQGNFLRYTGVSGIDKDPDLFLGAVGDWFKDTAIPNIKKSFTAGTSIFGSLIGGKSSGGSTGGNTGGMTANDFLLLQQQQEASRKAEQAERDAKTQQTLLYAGIGVVVLIILSVVALKFMK